ncbi:hypothetical protein FA95DRAFT_1560411 [Auriscalpium vulgare]|uniref:Uncharacterized protein n=1 Tax=Auriscalpium vulgare TaxID=40419 RepID=A0ACB8RQC5_9AGAM|nr:hypothetical protein FA95DRAFT_1560411 [Auriscalpium vulgare]
MVMPPHQGAPSTQRTLTLRQAVQAIAPHLFPHTAHTLRSRRRRPRSPFRKHASSPLSVTSSSDTDSEKSVIHVFNDCPRPFLPSERLQEGGLKVPPHWSYTGGEPLLSLSSQNVAGRQNIEQFEAFQERFKTMKALFLELEQTYPERADGWGELIGEYTRLRDAFKKEVEEQKERQREVERERKECEKDEEERWREDRTAQWVRFYRSTA